MMVVLELRNNGLERVEQDRHKVYINDCLVEVREEH